MAEIVFRTTFKLRRGLAEEWFLVDPILSEGEPGFEFDTGMLKIGNGVDKYSDLRYINADHFVVDGDDVTVVIKNNKIKIKGFDEAEEGSIPQKNGGMLAWVKMLSEGQVEQLIESKQDKLVSSDETNKVRINEDNTMEITSVNVEKLDDTGANLILFGGNA